MAISVITFDLDNTLWDVTPTLVKAEARQQQWLLKHRPGVVEAMDHAALWEFRKAVWKRHPQLVHHVSQMRIQVLYELQVLAGYGKKEAREGAQQAFDIFLQERHKVELYEDALEVLEELARDFTLGALTNGNANIYKTDAAEYFDFAFLAEDVGAAKPDPAMFQAALRKAGVTPAEIAHVGDDPDHDIRGAKAMGMHTVWMNAPGKAWPGDEKADREITNLRQLPEAIRSLS